MRLSPGTASSKSVDEARPRLLSWLNSRTEAFGASKRTPSPGSPRLGVDNILKI
jgi:hypothetical protein